MASLVSNHPPTGQRLNKRRKKTVGSTAKAIMMTRMSTRGRRKSSHTVDIIDRTREMSAIEEGLGAGDAGGQEAATSESVAVATAANEDEWDCEDSEEEFEGERGEYGGGSSVEYSYEYTTTTVTTTTSNGVTEVAETSTVHTSNSKEGEPVAHPDMAFDGNASSAAV